MGTNKKTILISWLIGVGFGLFFSGIILSILLYTTNKIEPAPVKAQEQTEEAQPIGMVKTVEKHQIENTSQMPEVADKDAQADQDQAIEQDQDIKTIELDIKLSATAKEITSMLVENEIISDYDEFIAYIVAQDAERTLSHGKKVFPLNSDIETVFKILRPYK